MQFLKQLDCKNIIRDVAFVSFTTYWAAVLTGGMLHFINVADDIWIFFYGTNFLTAVISFWFIGRWIKAHPFRHIIIVAVIVWIISFHNVNFSSDWLVDIALISSSCFGAAGIAMGIIYYPKCKRQK